MTLYEMLDKTLFHQIVWIYETNTFDQNMPLFVGTVENARANTEKVWDYLTCEVEHYECATGNLLIQVRSKYYDSKMEEHYFSSQRWEQEEGKRPWRYSHEIRKEILEVALGTVK